MRIDAEFDCDVKSIAMHKDEDTGMLTMTPKVSVLVGSEACAEMFGDDVHRLAFVAGLGAVGYDKIKPRVVAEKHVLSIAGGDSVPTLPVVDSIEPSNVAEVRVYLKLPFVYKDKADAIKLIDGLMHGLRVRLQPAQMELPIGEAA